MKNAVTIAMLTAMAMLSIHALECDIPASDSSSFSVFAVELRCNAESGDAESGIHIDANEMTQALLCASNACKAMIASLDKLWPTECTINGTVVRADVTVKVATACNWTSTTATSSSLASFPKSKANTDYNTTFGLDHAL